MRRASFEVSTCIVRCESVHRSTHVLTSFGVSRKTNRQQGRRIKYFIR